MYNTMKGKLCYVLLFLCIKLLHQNLSKHMVTIRYSAFHLEQVAR